MNFRYRLNPDVDATAAVLFGIALQHGIAPHRPQPEKPDSVDELIDQFFTFRDLLVRAVGTETP